jgi:large subunit ribosomal protein L3
MPGQSGNKRTTIQNLRVAKILEDENAIAVTGSVPGSKGGLVMLRTAVKKQQT